MKLDKIKNNKPPSMIGDTTEDKLKNEHSIIETLWSRITKLEFELNRLNSGSTNYNTTVSSDNVINPLYLGDPDDLKTVRIFQENGIVYLQKQSVLHEWDIELWKFYKGIS